MKCPYLLKEFRLFWGYEKLTPPGLIEVGLVYPELNWSPFVWNDYTWVLSLPVG